MPEQINCTSNSMRLWECITIHSVLIHWNDAIAILIFSILYAEWSNARLFRHFCAQCPWLDFFVTCNNNKHGWGCWRALFSRQLPKERPIRGYQMRWQLQINIVQNVNLEKNIPFEHSSRFVDCLSWRWKWLLPFLFAIVYLHFYLSCKKKAKE